MEFLSEKVDELPLLLEMAQKLLIEEIFEKYFPTHGNQKGLSNGQVFMAWLSYILSEDDHRKSHVSSWASLHKNCLKAFFQQEIDPSEFNDDRLTSLLTKMSEDKTWYALENDLWKGAIQVLQISSNSNEESLTRETKLSVGRKIRLDSTTSYGYHEVNEEGIMRYSAHSKDHRPDLPQLKIMMATDDELSIPIATDIVQGNRNDDILYLPNIKRVRSILPHIEGKRNLYCGDSKMSSLSIREDLEKHKDYYICPMQLNTTVKKKLYEEMVEKAVSREAKLEEIYKTKGDERDLIGVGFESEQEIGEEIKWKERVLLVRSDMYADSEKEKFEKEVNEGVEAINKLKSKKCKTEEEAQKELEKKVTELVKKYELEELVKIEYKKEEEEKTYERTETEKGKKRGGNYTIKKIKIFAKAEKKKEEIEEKKKRLGWRIYLTNTQKEEMKLGDCYNHYRGAQYIIENSFHVLKDKPIGIRPIYVWKAKQIIGVMRLLTMALKIASVITSKIRMGLEKANEELSEIYAGQPKKRTASPSIKTILNLFYRQGIIFRGAFFEGTWKLGLSKMSSTCERILSLLQIEDAYNKIISFFQNSPLTISSG